MTDDTARPNGQDYLGHYAKPGEVQVTTETARPSAEAVRALAELLRADRVRGDGIPVPCLEMDSAAAAMLTRLLADRERAEAEIATLHNRWDAAEQAAGRLQQRAERAEAERDYFAQQAGECDGGYDTLERELAHVKQERDEARSIAKMADVVADQRDHALNERDEARAALADAETELLHCRDTASKVEDMERALAAAERERDSYKQALLDFPLIERELEETIATLAAAEQDAANALQLARNLHRFNGRHGRCNPREDRACSYCNALDDLMKMGAEWKGHKIYPAAAIDSAMQQEDRNG